MSRKKEEKFGLKIFLTRGDDGKTLGFEKDVFSKQITLFFSEDLVKKGAKIALDLIRKKKL